MDSFTFNNEAMTQASDFTKENPVFQVKANVAPAATGPGNAHPSHVAPYGAPTPNPTYAGSLYPVD
jgi:hypothetical protein